MSTIDLSTIGAGFSNLAIGSQTLFRATMHALAHPARMVTLAHDARAPEQAKSASAAALLALLDADCTLWLSPRLASGDAPAWIRFHTGSVIVADHRDAQFLWVAYGDAPPPLRELKQGTDTDPDQGATCFIDVASIGQHKGSGAWRLTGPGILNESWLNVDGLPADFAAVWQANHDAFPCGVDVFLATDAGIVGLPRSTLIAAGAASEH
jgi:alpha-D-ribose 1-methylphosphonate 5-triphosphate synthase subunit PhnH